MSIVAEGIDCPECGDFAEAFTDEHGEEVFCCVCGWEAQVDWWLD